MLVQLIQQSDVGAGTGLAFVGADRLEERFRVRVVQAPDLLVPARLHHPAGHVRRHADHAHRVAEQDHRLITLGRGSIDLGSFLTVRHQAVEADSGNQRAFPRALAGLDIGQAKAAITVVRHPAKQAAHHERLPGREQERHSLVVAAVEAQHLFKKAQRSIGCILVPDQTAGGAVLQIAQVPGTGVANIRPRNELARLDRMGEGRYPVIN